MLPLLFCFLQANSNCADAKANLEKMCKDLSVELAHFDWRKEVELREILIEYSALRSEHFEKVCAYDKVCILFFNIYTMKFVIFLEF